MTRTPAPHEQGSDAVRAHRRKDSECRVLDQVNPQCKEQRPQFRVLPPSLGGRQTVPVCPLGFYEVLGADVQCDQRAFSDSPCSRIAHGRGEHLSCRRLVLKIAPLLEELSKAGIIPQREEVEILRGNIRSVRPDDCPNFRIELPLSEEAGVVQTFKNRTVEGAAEIGNSATAVAEPNLELKITDISCLNHVNDHPLSPQLLQRRNRRRSFTVAADFPCFLDLFAMQCVPLQNVSK